jgi:RNA polymerase sigma factor (sigma-70 family)
MTDSNADLPTGGQIQPADPRAQEIFNRYARRLSRLAEQHLDQRVRARVDGDDIVQSVMRTFFRRSAAGEFAVDGSIELWRLLAHITVMRARRGARFHGAQRRNVAKEATSTKVPPLDGVSRGPDPADAVVIVETLEQLVAGLPPLHAQVLDLRLQGCEAAEIAAKLEVSRSTVHRALRLLQQRLMRQQADGESPAT